MKSAEILVATANPGKLREIGELLADMPVSLTSLRDHWDPVPQIPEDGSTFLENAFAKADWVYSRKGIWALADDSGLEVDFLGGDPGVRSARFSGDDVDYRRNNAKLLALLDGAPRPRTARFRCVIVLRTDTDKALIADGVCEGTIGAAPRGDKGFGYDPLFIPDGYDATFAQLDSPTKNRISHRGKALRALKSQLAGLLV